MLCICQVFIVKIDIKIKGSILVKSNNLFNLNRGREREKERERERERERLRLKIHNYDIVIQKKKKKNIWITASYIKRRSRTLRPKTCTGLTISGARQLS